MSETMKPFQAGPFLDDPISMDELAGGSSSGPRAA